MNMTLQHHLERCRRGHTPTPDVLTTRLNLLGSQGIICLDGKRRRLTMPARALFDHLLMRTDKWSFKVPYDRRYRVNFAEIADIYGYSPKNFSDNMKLLVQLRLITNYKGRRGTNRDITFSFTFDIDNYKTCHYPELREHMVFYFADRISFQRSSMGKTATPEFLELYTTVMDDLERYMLKDRPKLEDDEYCNRRERYKAKAAVTITDTPESEVINNPIPSISDVPQSTDTTPLFGGASFLYIPPVRVSRAPSSGCTFTNNTLIINNTNNTTNDSKNTQIADNSPVEVISETVNTVLADLAIRYTDLELAHCKSSITEDVYVPKRYMRSLIHETEFPSLIHQWIATQDGYQSIADKPTRVRELIESILLIAQMNKLTPTGLSAALHAYLQLPPVSEDLDSPLGLYQFIQTYTGELAYCGNNTNAYINIMDRISEHCGDVSFDFDPVMKLMIVTSVQIADPQSKIIGAPGTTLDYFYDVVNAFFGYFQSSTIDIIDPNNLFQIPKALSRWAEKEYRSHPCLIHRIDANHYQQCDGGEMILASHWTSLSDDNVVYNKTTMTH